MHYVTCKTPNSISRLTVFRNFPIYTFNLELVEPNVYAISNGIHPHIYCMLKSNENALTLSFYRRQMIRKTIKKKHFN